MSSRSHTMPLLSRASAQCLATAHASITSGPACTADIPLSRRAKGNDWGRVKQCHPDRRSRGRPAGQGRRVGRSTPGRCNCFSADWVPGLAERAAWRGKGALATTGACREALAMDYRRYRHGSVSSRNSSVRPGFALIRAHLLVIWLGVREWGRAWRSLAASLSAQVSRAVAIDWMLTSRVRCRARTIEEE